MGSQVSHAAMRVLYTDITLEDDMRYHTTWATSPVLLGPLAALLNNPMRYGTFVRRLIVREPTQFNDFEPLETVKRRAGSPLLQFDDAVEDEDDDMESQGVIRPLEWAKVHELLSWCPGLTDLVWRSSTPPPDGLCEVRTVNCLQNSCSLTRIFTCSPWHSSTQSSCSSRSFPKHRSSPSPLKRPYMLDTSHHDGMHPLCPFSHSSRFARCILVVSHRPGHALLASCAWLLAISRCSRMSCWTSYGSMMHCAKSWRQQRRRSRG